MTVRLLFVAERDVRYLRVVRTEFSSVWLRVIYVIDTNGSKCRCADIDPKLDSVLENRKLHRKRTGMVHLIHSAEKDRIIESAPAHVESNTRSQGSQRKWPWQSAMFQTKVQVPGGSVLQLVSSSSSHLCSLSSPA